MDAGFVTAKKHTTTTSSPLPHITHVGSHFSLGSTAQPKFVCNQPNFSRKMFTISRILAGFFSLHDNSANMNIISIFFQPYILFSDCRLVVSV